jgi:hypothetical protein
MSAAKSGYITAWSNSTPNEYKRYEVQIALAPASPAHSGTAISGTVRSAPYNQIVESPTVRLLKDGALLQTTTATAKGWYMFDGLDAATTYTVNVTKTGFVPYSNGVTTGAENSVTLYDPILSPLYTLRFNLRDSHTLALITDDMGVVLGNGQNARTTTGIVNFADIPMGSMGYTITGSGHETITGTVVMDQNQNLTIYVPQAVVVPTTVAAITTTPPPSLISVSGTVRAMITGGSLAGANVTIVQGSTTRYAITPANGAYNISGLMYNQECTINVTKASFTHTAFKFTPVGSDKFLVDLYMQYLNEETDPSLPPEPGCAGAGGMVLGGVFHQLITQPTVTVSNATWSGPATINGDGVWWLGTLKPNSPYNVTAAASGYVTKIVPFTTGAATTFTTVDVVLDQVYTLTINVRDAASNALITATSAQVKCSNGQTKNTTGGIAVFPNLAYNTYTFQATCTGYSQNGISVLVYGSITADLFLQKLPDSGSSEISYTIPPHNVRFVCQNLMGQPLGGINVTAHGTTTTVPDRGIFDAIFGWTDKYTTANLTSVSMHDTTASDGSVVFLMSELLKYRLTFTGTGIDQTIDIYPQESVYVITLGDRPFDAPAATAVNTTVWAVAPEGADAVLHAYYRDTASRTTSVVFTVRNQTHVVYTQTYANQATVTASYTVPHESGVSYTWGIVAQHQDHGKIEKWNGITLHSKLIDLGLEEVYYLWISIAALIMFTALFTGMNARYGYVLVPAFSMILWYIGWLPISSVVVFSAAAVGLLLAISRGSGG